MKIAVTIHGTRGDVEPCAAVALELQGRGHDVTMAVPPNLVGFVESVGLGAVAYGPDSQQQLQGDVFERPDALTAAGPADWVRLGNPLNAAIWRYHPTQHAFEVFTEGTSNPWGVDFDDNGQAFSTACVIPHLYYNIPGARYQRQAGNHFSPYTYADIQTIADHRHYVGENPHGGNGRSNDAGGGHAHSGAMIYLGGAWPEELHELFARAATIPAAGSKGRTSEWLPSGMLEPWV